MKIKLSLFFFFFTLFSFGQDFAPLGAKWHYSLANIVPYYESYKVIESVLDTTIEGIPCTKLVEYTPDDQIIDTHFIYSKNDSVFFYANDGFRLLYDFNAREGDTIVLDYYSTGTGDGAALKLRVSSSETININGEERLVQNLLGFNELAISFGGTVIEGIGNIHFLFPRLEMSYIGPLRCYEDSFTGLFLNTIYTSSKWEQQDCEQIITGINTPDFPEDILVFPNPVTNTVFVNHVSGTTEYSIIDNTGEIVKSGSLESSGEINISELSKGVYFVMLKNNEIMQTKKIIKK